MATKNKAVNAEYTATSDGHGYYRVVFTDTWKTARKGGRSLTGFGTLTAAQAIATELNDQGKAVKGSK